MLLGINWHMQKVELAIKYLKTIYCETPQIVLTLNCTVWFSYVKKSVSKCKLM